MTQLVYVSTSSVAFSDQALRELLASARVRNASVGVTGMLLHQAGTFIQVLEGEDAVLEQLFAHIAADQRHHHVLTLSRKQQTSRDFAEWTMGFVDVKGSASRLPGFRTVGDLRGIGGDTGKLEKLVRSFRDGRWRQHQTA